MGYHLFLFTRVGGGGGGGGIMLHVVMLPVTSRHTNLWCQKSGTPILDPYWHKSSSNAL